MIWNKTKDQLPEARQDVLFVAEFGGEPMICFGYKHYPGDGDGTWYDKTETDRDGDPMQVFGVTHWMPLPDLPVEVLKKK